MLGCRTASAEHHGFRVLRAQHSTSAPPVASRGTDDEGDPPMGRGPLVTGTYPGQRRRRHGHGPVMKRGHERPRHGLQPAGRDDDDGAIPEFRRGRAEQRGLQLGARWASTARRPGEGGRARRRSRKRLIRTSCSGTPPTVCSRTRRSATVIACSTPSTSTSSISVRPPSSPQSTSRSNSPGFPYTAARRPAGARLHRRLKPPPLTLEHVPAGGGHLARRQEPGHVRSADSSAASSRS